MGPCLFSSVELCPVLLVHVFGVFGLFWFGFGVLVVVLFFILFI